jgi:ABC-type transport system involved in cytochrome bd biosynthesis fused ATPase/permease subunit
MLRTIFTVGVMALLGLFFGLGLFFVLAGFALKILLIGGCVYFVIRIVSPGTAKQLREKFSGTTTY